MTGETIAKALKGRKVGSAWMARCPAHEDREPSLSITETKDGTVLVRCHAGCSQHDVIAALRSLGLWQTTCRRAGQFPPSLSLQNPETPDSDALKRTEAALAIWRASQSTEGTPVATYLRSRHLHLSAPGALRCHGGLRHSSGGVWPAMVALVTHGNYETPIAIHRTFLARDGRGKAPVEPTKMMLGPCRGGVVRLGIPDKVLLIGEGIETCLAAMQETGHAAWAALSTSGLRTLNLSHNVRDVIVLADGDVPGEAAAQDCALRWKREGRRVRIARAPQGMDFNDLLVARRCIKEGAR